MIHSRDAERITVRPRLASTAEPVWLGKGTGGDSEGQRSAASVSRDQECRGLAAAGAGLRAVRHVVACGGGLGRDDRPGEPVGRGGPETASGQRPFAARERPATAGPALYRRPRRASPA